MTPSPPPTTPVVPPNVSPSRIPKGPTTGASSTSPPGSTTAESATAAPRTSPAGSSPDTESVRVARVTTEQIVLRDTNGRAQTLDASQLTADERRLVRLAAERDLTVLLTRDPASGQRVRLAPGPALLLAATTQPVATNAARDALINAINALRRDATLNANLRAGPPLAMALAQLVTLTRGVSTSSAGPFAGTFVATIGDTLFQALSRSLPTLDALPGRLRDAASLSAGTATSSSPLFAPGLFSERNLLDVLLALVGPAPGGAASLTATQNLAAWLGNDLKALLLVAAAQLRAGVAHGTTSHPTPTASTDSGQSQAVPVGHAAQAETARLRLTDALQTALQSLLRSQVGQMFETLSAAATRATAENAVVRDGWDTQTLRGSLPFWWGLQDDARSTLEQLDWRYRRRRQNNGDERFSFRMTGEWPGLGAFVAQIEGLRAATAASSRASGVASEAGSSAAGAPHDGTVWKLSVATAEAAALEQLRAFWPDLAKRLEDAGFHLATPRLTHDPALVERLAETCRAPSNNSGPLDPDRPGSPDHPSRSSGGGLHLRA